MIEVLLLVFALPVITLTAIAFFFNKQWNKSRYNILTRKYKRQFNVSVVTAIVIATLIMTYLLATLQI